MELNNYLVDTVEALCDPQDGLLKMVTYRVMATSAEEAMKKFLNEQGTVVYEGEPTEHIIIGIQKEN